MKTILLWKCYWKQSHQIRKVGDITENLQQQYLLYHCIIDRILWVIHSVEEIAEVIHQGAKISLLKGKGFSKNDNQH